MKVSAPEAWTVTAGSANTVVALLDSGVDFSHPDMQGAFVPGFDFVNNDTVASDDFGHGTAVAGIIAARSNNGLGIAGYCGRCSIMPVKVLDARGSASLENLALGIRWAVDHGARVIAMSFVLGGGSDTVRQAIEYAQSRGAVLVGAAGNGGSTEPAYPAAYAGVIGVAGSDEADALYSWSNRGPWVDVAAPGCAATTTPNASYTESFCGTSASIPVVAALAALALSHAPSLTNVQVEQAITSSAIPLAGVANGRVDARRMLRALGA